MARRSYARDSNEDLDGRQNLIDNSSMSSSGSSSPTTISETKQSLFLSDLMNEKKKKKKRNNNNHESVIRNKYDSSQNSCTESNHSEILASKSPPININASSIDHQTTCVSDQISDETKKYRPQKFCAVCGDRAIACNFNAVTCESCKAFFRRNAFKEKLKCLFGNKCVIDKVTRRFCSRCRLKKCIDIGMKREWILSDEQKHKKRMKIIQNRQKRTDTNHSSLNSKDSEGSVINVEKKDASTSCPDESDMLEGSGPAFFFCPHDCLNCKNIMMVKSQAHTLTRHAYDNLSYSYNPNTVHRNIMIDDQCSEVSNEHLRYGQTDCIPYDSTTGTPISNSGDLLCAIPESSSMDCNRTNPSSLNTPIDSQQSFQRHQVVTSDDSGVDLDLTQCNQTTIDVAKCDENTEKYDFLLEDAAAYELARRNPFFMNSKAILFPNNLLSYDEGKTLFALPCVNDEQIQNRLSNINIDSNERRRINELLAAANFIFEPNTESTLSKKEGGDALENLVQMCDYSLRRFIQTIKQVDAFKILSMDDQIALLKTACFKILILRSAHHFSDNICGWRDAKTSKILSLEVLKQAKKSSVYEQHKSLLMTFDRPLREDRITVAILCMILLFDIAGYSDLERGAAIHAEHVNYLTSLKAYLLCVQPEPLTKYEKLMTTLNQINATNEEYNKFFSKDFQPAQITPLIVELFDLGSI